MHATQTFNRLELYGYAAIDLYDLAHWACVCFVFSAWLLIAGVKILPKMSFVLN